MTEEIGYSAIKENGKYTIKLHATLSWRNYEKLLDALKEIQKDIDSQ